MKKTLVSFFVIILTMFMVSHTSYAIYKEGEEVEAGPDELMITSVPIDENIEIVPISAPIEEAQDKDNTLLFVGIGAVGVLSLGLGFVILNERKKKEL